MRNTLMMSKRDKNGYTSFHNQIGCDTAHIVKLSASCLHFQSLIHLVLNY